VHPSALVESGEVGAGTRIWAFAHVMDGARVGRGCNIGEGCFVERGALLGDRVTVKNGVCVWEGVTLEDDVFVGPNAVFTNDLRPRSRVYHPEPDRTLVRRGASLGANATILSGIEIGERALVGAGAVVTRDVPAFGLVYGNPARLRGFVCACADTLDFRGNRAECRCGRRYARRGSAVRPIASRGGEVVR
jgi:acetyltransferase-like isoleucine patch superfamily enzyme